MSTKSIVARITGLAAAVIVALLLPISIGTGEGSSESGLVRLSDACASGNPYCMPAFGSVCFDAVTGSSLQNYICIGCGSEDPPGWGGGRP